LEEGDHGGRDEEDQGGRRARGYLARSPAEGGAGEEPAGPKKATGKQPIVERRLTRDERSAAAMAGAHKNAATFARGGLESRRCWRASNPAHAAREQLGRGPVASSSGRR
jgi:hypothetical protein